MRFPIVAMFVLSCAGDGPPEVHRCAQLRDHLVDLQVRDIHIAVAADREAHRRAMIAAIGDGFVENCSTKLSDSQVSCALEASDRAAASACAGGQP
jgi:hypothetical protein